MGNTGTAPDNELEQRYERYKETLRELTIMNDIFMRNVFKKKEIAEILNEKEETVKEWLSEKVF